MGALSSDGCFTDAPPGTSMFICGALTSPIAGIATATKFSPVTTTLRSATSRWRATEVGGWLGALMLKRVNEKALRVGEMAMALTLTIGLLIKAPSGSGEAGP